MVSTDTGSFGSCVKILKLASSSYRLPATYRIVQVIDDPWVLHIVIHGIKLFAKHMLYH
jgi:hypothetical protein